MYFVPNNRAADHTNRNNMFFVGYVKPANLIFGKEKSGMLND